MSTFDDFMGMKHARPICNCHLCCAWRRENWRLHAAPNEPGFREWASPLANKGRG